MDALICIDFQKQNVPNLTKYPMIRKRSSLKSTAEKLQGISQYILPKKVSGNSKAFSTRQDHKFKKTD